MNSNKSNRSRSKSVLYLNLRGHIHLYVLPFNTLVVLTLICIYATDDPKKTQHLLSLDGAQERLHLFKADLLEEGSFDSAVEGCNGVFHTASPVALEDINPQVHPTLLYIHGLRLFINDLEPSWSIFQSILMVFSTDESLDNIQENE